MLGTAANSRDVPSASRARLKPTGEVQPLLVRKFGPVLQLFESGESRIRTGLVEHLLLRYSNDVSVHQWASFNIVVHLLLATVERWYLL